MNRAQVSMYVLLISPSSYLMFFPGIYLMDSPAFHLIDLDNMTLQNPFTLPFAQGAKLIILDL
jgi:hypothetical protein